jgi:hypothetical protein
MLQRRLWVAVIVMLPLALPFVLRVRAQELIADSDGSG